MVEDSIECARTASCSQVFYAKAKKELQQNTGPLDTHSRPGEPFSAQALHETFDPTACPRRKDSQGQLRVAALKVCGLADGVTQSRQQEGLTVERNLK